MKKLVISLLVMALAASGCGDVFRKLDPRNDDSITYHNKFVENTNTILEKTRSAGNAYSALLTQVENATKKVDKTDLDNALDELKKTHTQAQSQLEKAKSKNEADHSTYIIPFQNTYIPSLEELETAYNNLIAYFTEQNDGYEISKLEELTLKIDEAHQEFIEKHNTFIDAINMQVQ